MATNVNAALQKASLHTDEDRLVSPSSMKLSFLKCFKTEQEIFAQLF